MRRSTTRLLIIVMLFFALMTYPQSDGHLQVFAQTPPTATATPFSSEDLLPGVLDVLTTRLAEVTPSIPAPEPVESPTGAATQEEREPSPTLRTSATVSAETTAAPIHTASATVAVSEPTTVPPASATSAPVDGGEEAVASGGVTPFLVAGGIGLLAVVGFVLWRRR